MASTGTAAPAWARPLTSSIGYRVPSQPTSRDSSTLAARLAPYGTSTMNGLGAAVRVWAGTGS